MTLATTPIFVVYFLTAFRICVVLSRWVDRNISTGESCSYYFLTRESDVEEESCLP